MSSNRGAVLRRDGLAALEGGTLSVEDFVRLNEGVGSYTNDLVWTGGSSANPVIPAPRHGAQTRHHGDDDGQQIRRR